VEWSQSKEPEFPVKRESMVEHGGESPGMVGGLSVPNNELSIAATL